MKEILNFSPAAADGCVWWREHLDEPHLYPREEDFYGLVHEVSTGLKKLCCSEGQVLLLTSAGTGALECAIAALPPAKRVLVIRNGYFGNRLLEIARLHLREVNVFDLPFGQPLTENHEDDLTIALKASRAEAILAVHLETSSGLLNDIALVGRVAREHAAIAIVDGISSAGSVECRLDEWGVHCFVASTYKALATPVGLSFILATESYLDKASRRWFYYFDLDRLARAARQDHFLWSPNVLNLHCLKGSLSRIAAQGEETYFRALGERAAQFREWLLEAGLEIFGDPACLSPCFTTLRLKEPNADLWLKRLKQDHGLVIGKGIGDGAESFLRIGHYPVHSLDDLQGLAEAMKQVMSAEL